jgi:cytidyltransferase-like protein
LILTFEQLREHRGKVAMVDGGFDPLHAGHVVYFKAAADLGAPVLCNLAADRYVARKHAPFLPEAQRLQVVESIRHIDHMHLNEHDTETVLRQLQPKYYVKGKDWEGRLPQEQVEICAELGIEVVYLDTVLDSSTRILDDHCPCRDTKRLVAGFEDFVRQQSPSSADAYDAEYFTEGWRDDGHAYTLESRREREADHPQVIKDVFEPQRALDIGCGPGFLMLFLQEIGVHADGIDHSADVLELAPPEVRDRIRVADIADTSIPADSYDLVLCREVFEHLTLLQVRVAVANICRMSSRYAYVTTRFNRKPEHLFSVQTKDDLDPTHITRMNKDLLRLMFVLEGFRCRPDLEAKIDWLGKGRVMVYEKAR